LADLNVSVGDEASSREDPMVEIRVAVPGATRVHGLMRLNGLRPRDPGDSPFTVVGPVPIASVS
jgi:hypothetical protein